ncbi:Aste57867_18151 [Aphanomyces stellatus]|uniref:Aste57867_18151 protein n=1 Tax=Aphanomyces stellatus TaxID=120398 RepID=A0A485L9L2_9STRA|nr:hypothetical protein As57867_018089 [Aphanomyces stellatus]VFT94889.1 Aste57867_18151 [Aphanomyces stellatus]
MVWSSERRRREELFFVQKHEATTLPRGHCWLLLDADWMERWWQFAAADGPPPGPISNESLVQDDWKLRILGDVPGDPDLPRDGLQLGRDYRCVTPLVWCVLVELHGTRQMPPMARYTKDMYASPLPATTRQKILKTPRMQAHVLVQTMQEHASSSKEVHSPIRSPRGNPVDATTTVVRSLVALPVVSWLELQFVVLILQDLFAMDQMHWPGASIAAIFVSVPTIFVHHAVAALGPLAVRADAVGAPLVVGVWLQAALAFATLAAAAVVLCYLYLLDDILHWSAVDAATAASAERFAATLTMGLLPQFWFSALATVVFHDTNHDGHAVALAHVAAWILNGGLNVASIASGGATGASSGPPAMASVVTQVAQCLGFAVYALCWNRSLAARWGGWSVEGLRRLPAFLAAAAPGATAGCVSWFCAAVMVAVAADAAPAIAVALTLLQGLRLFCSAVVDATTPNASSAKTVATLLVLVVPAIVLAVVEWGSQLVQHRWADASASASFASLRVLFAASVALVAVRATLQVWARDHLDRAFVQTATQLVTPLLVQLPLTYVLPVAWGWGTVGFWWAILAGEGTTLMLVCFATFRGAGPSTAEEEHLLRPTTISALQSPRGGSHHVSALGEDGLTAVVGLSSATTPTRHSTVRTRDRRKYTPTQGDDDSDDDDASMGEWIVAATEKLHALEDPWWTWLSCARRDNDDVKWRDDTDSLLVTSQTNHRDERTTTQNVIASPSWWSSAFSWCSASARRRRSYTAINEPTTGGIDERTIGTQDYDIASSHRGSKVDGKNTDGKEQDAPTSGHPKRNSVVKKDLTSDNRSEQREKWSVEGSSGCCASCFSTKSNDSIAASSNDDLGRRGRQTLEAVGIHHELSARDLDKKTTKSLPVDANRLRGADEMSCCCGLFASKNESARHRSRKSPQARSLHDDESDCTVEVDASLSKRPMCSIACFGSCSSADSDVSTYKLVHRAKDKEMQRVVREIDGANKETEIHDSDHVADGKTNETSIKDRASAHDLLLGDEGNVMGSFQVSTNEETSFEKARMPGSATSCTMCGLACLASANKDGRKRGGETSIRTNDRASRMDDVPQTEATNELHALYNKNRVPSSDHFLMPTPDDVSHHSHIRVNGDRKHSIKGDTNLAFQANHEGAQVDSHPSGAPRQLSTQASGWGRQSSQRGLCCGMLCSTGSNMENARLVEDDCLEDEYDDSTSTGWQCCGHSSREATATRRLSLGRRASIRIESKRQFAISLDSQPSSLNLVDGTPSSMTQQDVLTRMNSFGNDIDDAPQPLSPAKSNRMLRVAHSIRRLSIQSERMHTKQSFLSFCFPSCLFPTHGERRASDAYSKLLSLDTLDEFDHLHTVPNKTQTTSWWSWLCCSDRHASLSQAKQLPYQLTSTQKYPSEHFPPTSHSVEIASFARQPSIWTKHTDETVSMDNIPTRHRTEFTRGGDEAVSNGFPGLSDGSAVHTSANEKGHDTNAPPSWVVKQSPLRDNEYLRPEKEASFRCTTSGRSEVDKSSTDAVLVNRRYPLFDADDRTATSTLSTLHDTQHPPRMLSSQDLGTTRQPPPPRNQHHRRQDSVGSVTSAFSRSNSTTTVNTPMAQQRRLTARFSTIDNPSPASITTSLQVLESALNDDEDHTPVSIYHHLLVAPSPKETSSLLGGRQSSSFRDNLASTAEATAIAFNTASEDTDGLIPPSHGMHDLLDMIATPIPTEMELCLNKSSLGDESLAVWREARVFLCLFPAFCFRFLVIHVALDLELVFLGHLGVPQLAGAALVRFWIAIPATFLHMSMRAVYVLALQARHFGHDRAAGLWLQTGLAFAAIATACVAYYYVSTADVVHMTEANPVTVEFGRQYAPIMLLGLFPLLAHSALVNFMQVHSPVDVPVVVCATIGCILNGWLHVVYIYGAFGWFGWGFVGSPYATVTSLVVQLGLFMLYTVGVQGYHKPYWPGWSWLSLRFTQWRFFWAVAAPLGVAALLEAMLRCVVGTVASYVATSHPHDAPRRRLVDQEENDPVDAGSIRACAWVISFCLFLIGVAVFHGVAEATKTRMLGYIASGRANLARHVLYVGAAYGAATSFVLAALLYVYRPVVFRLWTNDASVLAMGVDAVAWIMFCLVLAGVRVVLAGGLVVLSKRRMVDRSRAVDLFGIQLPASVVLPILLQFKALSGFWMAVAMGECVHVLLLLYALCQDDDDAVDDAALVKKVQGARVRQHDMTIHRTDERMTLLRVDTHGRDTWAMDVPREADDDVVETVASPSQLFVHRGVEEQRVTIQMDTASEIGKRGIVVESDKHERAIETHKFKAAVRDDDIATRLEASHRLRKTLRPDDGVELVELAVEEKSIPTLPSALLDVQSQQEHLDAPARRPNSLLPSVATDYDGVDQIKLASTTTRTDARSDGFLGHAEAYHADKEASETSKAHIEQEVSRERRQSRSRYRRNVHNEDDEEGSISEDDEYTYTRPVAANIETSGGAVPLDIHDKTLPPTNKSFRKKRSERPQPETMYNDLDLYDHQASHQVHIDSQHRSTFQSRIDQDNTGSSASSLEATPFFQDWPSFAKVDRPLPMPREILVDPPHVPTHIVNELEELKPIVHEPTVHVDTAVASSPEESFKPLPSIPLKHVRAVVTPSLSFTPPSTPPLQPKSPQSQQPSEYDSSDNSMYPSQSDASVDETSRTMSTAARQRRAKKGDHHLHPTPLVETLGGVALSQLHFGKRSKKKRTKEEKMMRESMSPSRRRPSIGHQSTLD